MKLKNRTILERLIGQLEGLSFGVENAKISRKGVDYMKISIDEAVRSGGMILAGLDVLWNTYQFNYCENAFILCGDIDTRCVYMAYIQLSLAGVPAAIRHQNGLTLETWDEWHTPALKMQYLKFRKYLNLR